MLSTRAGLHSLETCHWMVILWLALNALDVLTTHIGLHFGALEANPIVAGLVARSGEIATYGLKLLFALVVVTLLYKLERQPVFKWANVVMSVIIASNIAVLAYTFSG